MVWLITTQSDFYESHLKWNHLVVMVTSVNFTTRANHIQGADSCDSVLLSLQIFSFGLSCTHRQT